MLRLIVEGSDPPLEFDLRDSKIRIGRATKAQISLPSMCIHQRMILSSMWTVYFVVVAISAVQGLTDGPRSQPYSSKPTDDRLVSGRHCIINNGVLLDEKSTNGTFLNGEKVRVREVKMGEEEREGTGELNGDGASCLSW